MGINVSEGPLVRLVDVPDKVTWLPTGRGGAKMNFATLYGYARHGLKNGAGHVIKLETLSVGRSLATNEAALLRFFERVGDDGATQNTPTESQKSEALKRAQAKLAAMGV
jgi:hypothetical protein